MFRYLACLFWVANETYYYYVEGFDQGGRVLAKTDWGWQFYGFYVIIVAYAHFRHDTQG